MGTMHDKLNDFEEVDCRQCIYLREYYKYMPICECAEKWEDVDKSDALLGRISRESLHGGDCYHYEPHRGQNLLHLAGIIEEEE